MLERIIGVFKLDAATFEEIEADQSAITEAALIVGLVALLSASGSGLLALVTEGGFVGSFISSFVSVFLGWIAWSAVVFVVGKSLFGGDADLGEMLRVIGYAFAPQLLAIIPCLGPIVGIIWTLLASIVAVRQGLDVTTGKAILTMVIGFVVYLLLTFVVSLLFGVTTAGLGAIF